MAEAAWVQQVPEAGQAPGWVDRQAYPFQSRWLSVGPGRMHYVDEGEGHPVLFVHGTPTWSFEWRHLVAGLAPRVRCVAPDLLGFGLSERPRDFAYSPEAHAEVLGRFVDALGLRDFTLVVHDFGGPVGLPLALSRPGRVRRVVLFNTWMWSLADDAQLAKGARLAQGGLGRLLYRWANASLKVLMPSAYGDRRKLTRAIHGQYLAPFPTADDRERVLWALARALLGSSDFYAGLWQQRAQLAALPTLILWGMRDKAFPPHLLARWREALPKARVVEVEEAGHWPHEESPEEVLREVRAFLGV